MPSRRRVRSCLEILEIVGAKGIVRVGAEDGVPTEGDRAVVSEEGDVVRRGLDPNHETELPSGLQCEVPAAQETISLLPATAHYPLGLACSATRAMAAAEGMSNAA
jgi:hypothetical protein